MPTLRGSATTSVSPDALIRSTSAGGNWRSMPCRIPIRRVIGFAWYEYGRASSLTLYLAGAATHVKCRWGYLRAPPEDQDSRVQRQVDGQCRPRLELGHLDVAHAPGEEL